MTSATIFMLVEEKHLPIPDDITIEQNFGRERVVDEDGKVIGKGDCMLLTAHKNAWNDWLDKFDGFWTTNNPMVGAWHIVHTED